MQTPSNLPWYLPALREVSKATCRTRGILRISEWIRRRYSKSGAELLIDDFDGSGRIQVNLGDHIESQIFWNGSYSYPELELAKRLIKKNDVIIDIGANIGEFTLFASRRCPDGKVYGFEPVKSIFNRLSKNVELNSLKNVVLENKGLFSKECEMEIFKSDSFGEDQAINRGMNNLFDVPRGSSGNSEKIKLTTLDLWASKNEIKKVDLIKMDIEGAEYPALQGGENLILKCKPKMILEIDEANCNKAGHKTDDLIGWLINHGYKINNIDDRGRISPLPTRSVKTGKDSPTATRNIFCEQK